MASPKKPLPEHVATQIAPTVPGGHPGGGAYAQGSPQDRRTAAMPQSQMPTAAPHAQTMMFDPHAPQPGARPSAHTVLTAHPQAPYAQPSGPRLSADPLPAPSPSGFGRWIAGPILAGAVGVLTLWIAGMVSSATPAAKNRGKLRLSSDPEGATVVVDGKLQGRPTPTVIEGEIGATLRVAFRLEGYLDKEADVFVGEGERPFRAKLDRRDVPPVVVPLPAPPVENAPPNLAPPVVSERRKKDRDRDRDGSSKREKVVPTSVAPSMSGTGALSVHVRPWAIVYVDGAKIRQTPLEGHSLTAGLHTVELVNDGLKKREKVTAEIRADKTFDIKRDWGE